MFYETTRFPERLGVFSGVLRNIDTDIVRLARHIFVEDTKDGGATVWLRRPNGDGEEIPRFIEFEGEMDWDWPTTLTSDSPKEEDPKEDLIPVWCHCKGIQLRLHRGDYASRIQAGTKDLPWFIDPSTGKPLAAFDACDSCRLQFGVDMVNWTFAELANISHHNPNEPPSPFPRTTSSLKSAVDTHDPAIGTLAYYASSPDVQRYFCRICSATVFYACDDRPDMVDVAIGLLESPDGARAEGFLSWNLGGVPNWAGDTKGGWREGLVKRVQNDAEEFRIARGWEKCWRRVQKEAERGV